MKPRRKQHGRVIDRVRARAEWAELRRQGRRVVELRPRFRTAQERAVHHLSQPVVWIGDEQSQRAVMRANRRNGLALR